MKWPIAEKLLARGNCVDLVDSCGQDKKEYKYYGTD